jgi:sugar diacid utilization regulator
VAEVEHRLRGDFVHDLMVGSFDHATIVERAARLGHDLTACQVVIAVAPDAPPPGQRDEWCRRVERSLRTSFHHRSLVAQTTVIGDGVVALLALPSHITRDRGAVAVVREVRTDLAAYAAPPSASVGVSGICREPAGLARAYDEALQALRTGQRLGQTGTVTAFDELGIERILLQLPDLGELARYVADVLGPLVAYDAEHATELLRTLDTYLAAGGHQGATASALGIHVNSLQYRLRRIREIGRLDLDDTETRLNAQLALRARQALRPGRRETPAD